MGGSVDMSRNKENIQEQLKVHCTCFCFPKMCYQFINVCAATEVGWGHRVQQLGRAEPHLL